MTDKEAVKLFEDKSIRISWDGENEEWLFSVVDVVGALTEVNNPRRYWSDLKRKMGSEEGFQLYDKIVQLKLKAKDGKRYLTDVANTEQLFRIIQSIPSKKAEPFKLWLAQTGRERIEGITGKKIVSKKRHVNQPSHPPLPPNLPPNAIIDKDGNS